MAADRISSFTFSPVRPKRRTSDKLIFISCEGSVTEWEYFEKIVNLAFENVSSKVRVINILEDVLKKKSKQRTSEENRLVTSASPNNLLIKMDDYKLKFSEEYDFDHNPDDEFWLVMDVDEHTNASLVDAEGKSNLDKWNTVLEKCREKNYNYAVSNPFFELWLLLHFDDINAEDRKYAVTSLHLYEPTGHFRERLADLNVPLKKDKHINERHYQNYSKEAIVNAIHRAENLESKPESDYPDDLGTTVYRLLKSIKEIDDQYEVS